MLKHKGTRDIKTERLLLRKITPEDAEMVFKWMSDPEVLKFEDWILHTDTAFTKGFISWVTNDYATDKIYNWGIQLGEELIGNILVTEVLDEAKKGTIGYYLRKDCWSKGYATEAVKAVIRYMFSEVGLYKIDARHAVKNRASGTVLQKAGMAYTGHVKEYYYCHSEWHDCDFYAITQEGNSI
ncbi:GNAT family N-acetyltransferase [Breznakiella homolactica]|uniref:GNAT family N-acetyltransferase n=1 Tax=Breznakiella homolactica TaxID=2798577 RepID=A0A7T7XK41_9SPIR|nr:GNAT family N-acetyltransferase [Breznakiella homolactica]QQO07648.1 GNAT family N-acetyltransferase [Breznakiella homolactica]